MKQLVAHVLSVVFALCMAGMASAASFSRDTFFTEEVLSVSPYRIQYTLSGNTDIRPTHFQQLGLTGQATLVYALSGAGDVFAYSQTLYVVTPGSYVWGFPPLVNADPNNPIHSITSRDGADFGIAFDDNGDSNGELRMRTSFIVELKPGFVYLPDHVHMQAVYLSDHGSPFIDVFRRR